LLSRAIDDGLGPDDSSALVGWVGALLGIGVLNAWLAIMRHRTMSKIRMESSFRTVLVVVRQATRLGAALPRRVTDDEVVTIGIGERSADAAGASPSLEKPQRERRRSVPASRS
jgi:hypothetical protein